MVVHQNGDVQFINPTDLPKYSQSQQNIYHFYKRLIIQSIHGGNISPLDDIVFKCNNGMYLSINDSHLLVANGNTMSETRNQFRIMPADTLNMPDEYYLRPSINSNHLNPSFAKHNDTAVDNKTQLYRIYQEKKRLGDYNVKDQEILLVDDLLSILVGVEGSFIRRVQSTDIKNSIQHSYQIEPQLESPSCDNGLLQMVSKIITLAEYHDILRLFISTNSNINKGLVLQYFSQGLKNVLEEYQQLVVQLEQLFHDRQLTIQQIWFHLQHTINSFQQLVNIFIIQPRQLNLHSTLLLETLFMGISMNTDHRILQIFKYLLKQASIPFTQLMKNYLLDGIADDSHHEFIVVQSNNKVSDYWVDKFIINKEIIKQNSFVSYRVFNTNLQNKILQTIKYVDLKNSLDKQSKVKDDLFEQEIIESINNSFQNQDFELVVEKTFNRANNELMQQINTHYKLKMKIIEFKKIYFSQKGDTIECLFESLNSQMQTNVEQLDIDDIDSLLQLAIKTSTMDNSMFNDNVKLSVRKFNIYEQMYQLDIIETREKQKIKDLIKQSAPLIECLSIQVDVEQPLDLFLDQQSQFKYQIVFRQILYIKYVEDQLARIWQQNQNIKQIFVFDSNFGLVYQMITFVRQLMDYYMNQVLEVNFVEFMESFDNSDNLDQIIEQHQQFINKCIGSMFVLEIDLLLQINKILNLCLSFTKNGLRILSEYHVVYQNLESRQKRQQKMDYDSVNVQIRKQQEIMELQRFIEDNQIDEINLEYQDNFENRMKQLIQCLKSRNGQDDHSQQIQMFLSKIDGQNYYQMKFGLQGYEDSLYYND